MIKPVELHPFVFIALLIWILVVTVLYLVTLARRIDLSAHPGQAVCSIAECACRAARRGLRRARSR